MGSPVLQLHHQWLPTNSTTNRTLAATAAVADRNQSAPGGKWEPLFEKSFSIFLKKSSLDCRSIYCIWLSTTFPPCQLEDPGWGVTEAPQDDSRQSLIRNKNQTTETNASGGWPSISQHCSNIWQAAGSMHWLGMLSPHNNLHTLASVTPG